jgi:hypothetical protein
MRSWLICPAILFVWFATDVRAATNDSVHISRCSTQLAEGLGRCAAMYGLPQLADQRGYCEAAAIGAYNSCIAAATSISTARSLPQRRPESLRPAALW